MTASYRLEWNELAQGLGRSAVVQAVNKTLAAAVTEAMLQVPRDTGNLANDIGFEEAKDDGFRIVGSFGCYTVDYALAVELGAAPHVIRPRYAGALWWPGAAHPVMRVNHPGNAPQPFLRPAADQEFPKLGARIRDEFGRIYGP